MQVPIKSIPHLFKYSSQTFPKNLFWSDSIFQQPNLLESEIYANQRITAQFNKIYEQRGLSKNQFLRPLLAQGMLSLSSVRFDINSIKLKYVLEFFRFLSLYPSFPCIQFEEYLRTPFYQRFNYPFWLSRTQILCF